MSRPCSLHIGSVKGRWATRSEQIKNRRPLFAIGNVPTEALWRELIRRISSRDEATTKVMEI